MEEGRKGQKSFFFHQGEKDSNRASDPEKCDSTAKETEH